MSQADGKQIKDATITQSKLASSVIPTGVILPYEANSTNPTQPDGWLLCNGQAVSRTTFANLFALISTSHGVGNGSTTFNVPDYRGRALVGFDNMGGVSANRITNTQADTIAGAMGAETHTLTTGELAAHLHTHALPPAALLTAGGGTFNAGNLVNANTGLTGGGGSHNNVQPTSFTNFIIKT